MAARTIVIIIASHAIISPRRCLATLSSSFSSNCSLQIRIYQQLLLNLYLATRVTTIYLTTYLIVPVSGDDPDLFGEEPAMILLTNNGALSGSYFTLLDKCLHI